ncbi:MAG TPA: alpha/beta fold hydrolase [Acidimicrobiia bacterium]|nr:alpha/beta fold hydrolase [Acidimicrobiia bacterium]
MEATTGTERVRSADGTTIAFERSGSGPAVILVDGASCWREMGPMRPIAEQLSGDVTAVAYDRRGRGESTDTKPYAIEREVEDLAALIEAVGGSAALFGVSSGALLAIQAAAAGLPVTRLVLMEPPLGDDPEEQRKFVAELATLTDAGKNREAVQHFQRSIGIPEEMLAQMEGMLPMLEPIAPTLVYDSTISAETDSGVVSRVGQPALVLHSQGSPDNLVRWAQAVTHALPNGELRAYAGGWHGIEDDRMLPDLVEFLTEG